jgi:hypothetical protein
MLKFPLITFLVYSERLLLDLKLTSFSSVFIPLLVSFEHLTPAVGNLFHDFSHFS